jgi:hypothetical protein
MTEREARDLTPRAVAGEQQPPPTDEAEPPRSDW